MSSLADLPELVGFFSYSREDDEDSHGALSALRTRIQGELRGQLGRTAKTFRLWQDKEAIPSGALWETEIKNSVAQAVFFIPIITPTVVASPYCRVELDAFLAREAALGRSDLVFPILYIHVPALQDSVRREKDAVLSLIAKRQYADWREFRHLDANSTEVKRAVERFCGHIRDALNAPWLSPEERLAQERAAARQQAKDERKQQEAEARRQEEEAGKRAAAIRERERADEEQRQREDAAEQRSAEERHLREQAQAERRAADEQRRADKEARRGQQQSQVRPLWPPSRPALAAGSFVGLVAIGAIGVWLAESPTPAPLNPSAPGPVTPSVPVSSAPAPGAQAPPASVTPAPKPAVPAQNTPPAPLSAAPKHPPTPCADRLCGTVWTYKQAEFSDGRQTTAPQELHFLSGHVLQWTTYGTHIIDGAYTSTYSVNGNSVSFEVNNYSHYQGSIVGSQMQGTASNTAGMTWKWSATEGRLVK